jgi:hypothetical protein
MSDIHKDPRFAKALYDPQFHKMKKSKAKTSKDTRFKSFKQTEQKEATIPRPKAIEESADDSSDYSESDYEGYDGVVGHSKKANHLEDESEIQAQNIKLGRCTIVYNKKSRPSNLMTKILKDWKSKRRD